MKKFLVIMLSLFFLTISANADEVGIQKTAELMQDLQSMEASDMLSVYEVPSEGWLDAVFKGDFERTADFIDTAEKQIQWIALVSQYVGTTGRDVDASTLGLPLWKINMIRTNFLSCEKFSEANTRCQISIMVDIWNNPSYSEAWSFWASEISFEVHFDEAGKVARIKLPEMG